MGGDESAMKRLWGADPKLAQTIAGHVSKMDDRQREQAARQANVVGRAAMALHRLKQSGASDQEMAAQYAVYRKGMADSGFDVSGIPEAYTPDLGPRLKAMALESEAVGEMLKEVRWETVTNENGDPVSLRNPVTGEEKPHPRAPKAPLVKVETGNQRTFEEEMALVRAEERAKSMGKLDSATLDDYRELSASAEEQIPILRVMAELAPKLKTGALGQTALDIQKTAERLGVPLDISGDTTKAELFQKLSNQMTLLQRKPGTGEMSDSDREFFQNAVANLFTSPEGNALAIEFGMRRANRALDMEEQYSEWLRGGQEQPWATVRNKYLRENPLFTETDRAKAEAVSLRAGATNATSSRAPMKFESMNAEELLRLTPDEIGDDIEALNAYSARLKALRNGR